MDWVIQLCLIAAIFCIGGILQTTNTIKIISRAAQLNNKAHDYCVRRDEDIYVCGDRTDNHGISNYSFYTQQLEEEYQKVFWDYYSRFYFLNEEEYKSRFLELAIFRLDNRVTDKRLRYNKLVNNIIKKLIAKRNYLKKVYKSNLIPTLAGIV